MYRITFINHGKVYQLHAEQVGQAELLGFVAVSGLLFDTHTSLVVDPSEEKLKDELAGVSRLMVPMHSVIRIDEVEKRGQNKIIESDGGSNVTPFPSPFLQPGPRGDKS